MWKGDVGLFPGRKKTLKVGEKAPGAECGGSPSVPTDET